MKKKKYILNTAGKFHHFELGKEILKKINYQKLFLAIHGLN